MRYCSKFQKLHSIVENQVKFYNLKKKNSKNLEYNSIRASLIGFRIKDGRFNFCRDILLVGFTLESL